MYLASDPPGRVGREPHGLREVESIDRVAESQAAGADQVVEVETGAVPEMRLSDRDDEPGIRSDQAVPCRSVAGLSEPDQLTLFVGAE